MTITTTATGRVPVAPSLAHVALAVSVARADAASAYQAASAAAARVVARLDELGLPDRRTSRLGVHPHYDYGDTGPRLSGYEAATSLVVTLPPDRVAELLAGLVSDDVRVENLTFAAPDDPAAVSRARAAAYALARAAAEEYAALAGVRLGGLTRLVEGVDPDPPGERLLRVATVSDAMPVEPGSTDVTVTVTASWSVG